MKSNFISKKLFYLFWTLIITYLLLLLIGPRVPDNLQKEYCVRNFEINSYLGHSMNCDSADWMLNASDPSRLLDEESIRQPRPGLITTVHIFTYPLDFIFKIFGFFGDYPKKTEINLNYDQSEILYEKFHPRLIYLSYALVNFFIIILILKLAFEIFNLSIFNSRDYQQITAWLLIFLVFNNITNQFFWSPSTKLFNLLCGVFTIKYMIRIVEEKINHTELLMIFLVLGVSLLFYGVFIVSYSCLLFFYFFKNYKDDPLRSLSYILMFSVIFISPFLIWYAYIQSINSDFYFQVFREHNSVIWFIDLILKKEFGNAMLKFYDNSSFFISGFIKQYWFLILLFFTNISIFFKNINFSIKNSVVLASLFYFFIYTIFFSLVGYLPLNISAGLIVPILIIFIFIIKQNYKNCLRKKTFIITNAFTFFVFCIWSIQKFGPYS